MLRFLQSECNNCKKNLIGESKYRMNNIKKSFNKKLTKKYKNKETKLESKRKKKGNHNNKFICNY